MAGHYSKCLTWTPNNEKDHWDNDIIMAVLILEPLSSYVIQLVFVAVDPLCCKLYSSFCFFTRTIAFCRPVAKYDGAVKLT